MCNRQYRNILTPLVIIAVIFGVLFFGGCSDTPSITGYESYIVKSGDTLWDIARPIADEYNLDIRQIIFDIGEDDNIVIGQKILLPKY